MRYKRIHQILEYQSSKVKMPLDLIVFLDTIGIIKPTQPKQVEQTTYPKPWIPNSPDEEVPF